MAAEPTLTYETRKLLRVLLDAPRGEHYGLELAETAGLPIGSIYPILARLERARWVESAWEDIEASEAGRQPRKYYRLTPVGMRAARKAIEEVRRFFGLVPAKAER